ncbi:hypothetical protein CVD28_01095 [Bacillus sp. M6-12]|uniref:hypothetical protein n=1 Tax=Bacillus sp. M6-12 TaxID=2054166 RepID=UPI000C78C9F4|nr:hypothetical protein [Bacillus sp. M6-12]PLS19030.1 hypothetical protein CVD28_01095 [Bacillus sp. M6-12]
MTANEVISLGENISSPLVLWSFVIFGLSILLVLIILMVNKNKQGERSMLVSILGGFYALSMLTMIILFMTGMIQRSNSVEKWENEIALPYIESLEESKKAIMGVSFGVGRYRNIATIIVKDGEGVKKYEGSYEVKTTLSPGEQPYVGYKYLEQDLGYDIQKGYYDITVYVPQDYTF